MAELERVLSFKAIFLITVNALLGTGIFFSPAIAASVAYGGSFWAWLLMGVISIYVGLIFAELVGMYPTSGGVYEFSKQAFSTEISFLVGFLSLITGYIGIAMLIVGAVSYIAPTAPGYVLTLVALVLILLFHYVAYRGMETSAFMVAGFSVIMIGVLFVVLIPSIFKFSPQHVASLFSFCTATQCHPFGNFFAAAFIAAESFFGWEAAAFLAGETKNGEKVVPKAIIAATIFIVLTVVSLVFFILMAVGPTALAQNAASPFAFVAQTLFGAGFEQITALIVYISIIGCVAGGIIAMPRLICTMASDKLFIGQLSRIHPKHKTPANAIIFQAILTSLLVIFSLSSYKTLLQLLVPVALVMYSFVIVAQVVLRYTQPNVHRTFKIPGPNWLSLLLLPLYGTMIYLWMANTPGATAILMQGLSLVLLGIPVFLLLKVYYDPSFYRRLNDLFAWFVYLTEKINLPDDVKNEILLLLGSIKDKRVLEYGSSVGTLTVELAEKVSNTGRIYTTNISRKELDISKRRVLRRGHEHVVFIHDAHQVNRLHPDIPEVDVVVSLNMLTAIQDVKKVLLELHDVLVPNGKIVMVDYTNYFHIIPDVEWLTSDKEIKQIFRDCGFAVTVTRRKGKFWDYIYIHGIKVGRGKADTVLYI